MKNQKPWHHEIMESSGMGQPPNWPFVSLAVLWCLQAVSKLVAGPQWMSGLLLLVVCVATAASRLAYLNWDGEVRVVRLARLGWHPFLLVVACALINQIVLPGWQMPVSIVLAQSLLALTAVLGLLGALRDRYLQMRQPVPVAQRWSHKAESLKDEAAEPQKTASIW